MKQIILTASIIFIGFMTFGQEDKQIIEINNWIIEFIDSEPIAIPDYFDNQKEIDSISTNFMNSHRRALAIEKFQIEKLNPPVKIENRNRLITLENGTEFNLIPNTSFDETECTFERFYREKHILLFRVQWSEGNNYLMINTLTGEKTYSGGRPYFDKESDFFICINHDLDAEYSFNGFELFRLNDNFSIDKIWEFNPGWAPEKLKWIDKNTLIIKGYKMNTPYSFEKDWIYKKMKITKR